MARSTYYSLCLLVVVLGSCNAATYIDLGGKEWTVINATMKSPIPASVPGQIHTDLLAAGVIGDPYIGLNNDMEKWVSYSNWTYSRTFDVSTEALQKDFVQLVMLGLDTIASVSLNGEVILKTNNMFHRHVLNVKEHLKPTGNTISIQFLSKVYEANFTESQCDPSTSGFCPAFCNPSVYDGFCNVNFLRTEPCSFGWDWGIATSTVGIWRDIFLQAYSTLTVRDVVVATTPVSVSDEVAQERLRSGKYPDQVLRYTPEDGSNEAVIARAFQRDDYKYNTSQWNLKLQVYVLAGDEDKVRSADEGPGQTDSTVTGHLQVTLSSGAQIQVPVSVPAGTEQIIPVSLDGLSVEAWWPNGFGAAKLYNLSVVFIADGGTETDSWEGRIGFRTIELAQPDLPGGRAFFFKVNGLPIPVHGSNWVPADAFESRNTKHTYEKFFQAMADSHQNMMRNWGGGIYQHDFFYELADTFGIMIWHDMMWACADYAVPPAYLQSSAKEVRDNVRRIQHHPSIAIWAGNNEDEGRYNPKDYRVKYYGILTFNTVLNNISSVDQTRPMVGSSPSNGNETAEQPVGHNVYSPFYGDVHSYLYNMDCWNVSIYVRPRFTSEFGLQSWPSFDTMSKVFPPDQWTYNSPMSVNRNHHPDGQSEILGQISMHYHIPNGTNKTQNYADTLWLSQVYQAYCYKTEVEHFRRIRQQCTDTLPGCNMGQMFWQTNDIWQGASWSAIDYYGRYKMVQYFAQEFYRPQMASSYLLDNYFATYIINDNVNEAVSGSVLFRMHSWADGEIGTWMHKFEAVAPASASQVYDNTLTGLLKNGNCADPKECVLSWDLVSSQGKTLSSNYLFLASLKDVPNMKDPQLTISDVTQIDEFEFHLTLTSKAVAAFVWLETKYDGYFSDNGLFAASGAEFLLVFTARGEALTAAELQASIRVSSIYDTMQS